MIGFNDTNERGEALCAWAETCITDAEEACLRRLAAILGLRPGNDITLSSTRGKLPDCAVFDIGHLLVGDTMAFPASKHAFRAQLDLFNRSRPALQRWLGRLLSNLPIGPWQGRSNDLEPDTNVELLRIAPETDAISDVEIATLGGDKDGKGGVEVFTATVLLDVVFSTKEQPKE